jgi:putative ABC transport system ATP-binding protein
VRILDEVDLTVDLKGVTVVVGASGSGKSSLLRLANRLSAPTSGTVTLDGVDLASVDPLALRRRVGMVFQQPVLFAGSVADNLAVATRDLDRRAATRALERCGLDPGLLDREADQLSGGEAQRMCTARTLLTDPRVVLMDEVTSALDPAARTHTEALARQLANEGIAVVWVTHDLDQARRLGDRIVVLDAGRVLTGAAADAYLTGGPTGGSDAAGSDVPPTHGNGGA